MRRDRTVGLSPRRGVNCSRGSTVNILQAGIAVICATNVSIDNYVCIMRGKTCPDRSRSGQIGLDWAKSGQIGLDWARMG
jgi:hypothetical protein